MVDVEHRTDDLDDVRPLRGRADIEATTRRWFADTPEFGYEILDVLESDRAAAKRWLYRVPGAAGSVEVEGVTWLDCEAGEIREARVLFDSLRFFADSGRVRGEGTA
jgi:hypothetical protein